jgi:hypothetical protein
VGENKNGQSGEGTEEKEEQAVKEAYEGGKRDKGRRSGWRGKGSDCHERMLTIGTSG